MKHKWIPVAVALWLLGMLSVAGISPLGAQSVFAFPAAQSEWELVVRPPTAWHNPICDQECGSA